MEWPIPTVYPFHPLCGWPEATGEVKKIINLFVLFFLFDEPNAT